MIEQLRRFLATSGGRVLAIAATIALVVVAVYSAMGFFKGDTPDSAFYRVYIDPENGQSFRHKNEIGESVPLKSPFSGKNVAMPAEACYWNKDGTIRAEPYYLLLNSETGKPEPTFCPDCGRLVVPHNPKPQPGWRPPPTKQEWEASHGSPNP
jgi:hypothetical protein